MTSLEQFILNNLEALNQEAPPAKTWKQLKAQLDEDELIAFIQKHRNTLDDLEPSTNLWQNIQNALDEKQLQGFLKENKSSIDTFEPSKNLWGNISAQLDEEQQVEKKEESKVVTLTKEPKMVPLRVVWQLAASFVVLLVSVFTIQHFYSQSGGDSNGVQAELTAEQMQKIAPELAEAESYYTRVIHDKISQLRKYNLDETGVDIDAFEAEINKLDSAYGVLRNDLIESQSSEQVMGAMVENLQLRIEILNRQLLILEQIQQLKDGKTDEISI